MRISTMLFQSAARTLILQACIDYIFDKTIQNFTNPKHITKKPVITFGEWTSVPNYGIDPAQIDLYGDW